MMAVKVKLIWLNKHTGMKQDSIIEMPSRKMLIDFLKKLKEHGHLVLKANEIK
jgi:hypothetical protein